MKFKKTVLACVLAAIPAFACVNQAYAQDMEKIVIAARGGSHVDVINAVKEKFEKEHNVEIEVMGLENADLKQKIALDSRASVGAFDLVMLDDPWIPEFAKAGVLCDLTKNGYTDDSDFVKTSLDIGKDPYAKGDTYALPFAGNVTLLFFNQDVLKSVGATHAPDNWEDVLNIAQKAQLNGKLGYVVRGQQGNPIVGDYLPLLWAFGGDVFDENFNVTVNSPEGLASLEFYLQLAKTGANYEKNDIVASVASGKAAQALGWPSWFISGTDSVASYAVIPGKIDAQSKEYSAGVIGNWMMGITANCGKKDLAIELLKYLTSEEVQKAAADKGAVPTRLSVFNDKELSAKYPFYKTLLTGTQNSKVRPRTELWGEIENVYGIELSNALSGTKSAKQALADAQKAIEKIVK